MEIKFAFNICAVVTVLLILNACGSDNSTTEATSPKKDNVAACKAWQKSSLGALKSNLDSPSEFWAIALETKIAADLAEESLAKSMNIVAEKYESVTTDDLRAGQWTTTAAQDKAINYVLDTCESLGVKVRLDVNSQ